MSHRRIPRYWKIVFGVALVALQTESLAQVTEAARLFDEGNASYRDGEFDRARAAYEEITKMGYESGPLFQNLGNAYFRMDQLGQAMVNYQRALRLLPGDEEVEHNVKIVQSRSRDRFSRVPTPVLTKWWNGFMDRVGVRTVFWLGAIAWFLGTAAAALRIWNPASGPWPRRVTVPLTVTGFLLLACAVTTSGVRASVARGVIVSDRADVRSEPSQTARSTVVVHEALVVDVLQPSDEWVEIRLPNGVTGYVRSGSVQVV